MACVPQITSIQGCQTDIAYLTRWRWQVASRTSSGRALMARPNFARTREPVGNNERRVGKRCRQREGRGGGKEERADVAGSLQHAIASRARDGVRLGLSGSGSAALGPGSSPSDHHGQHRCPACPPISLRCARCMRWHRQRTGVRASGGQPLATRGAQQRRTGIHCPCTAARPASRRYLCLEPILQRRRIG